MQYLAYANSQRAIMRDDQQLIYGMICDFSEIILSNAMGLIGLTDADVGTENIGYI